MSKAGDWLKKKEIGTWRTAVSALRMEYTGGELTEEMIGEDPFRAFEGWFAEAVEHAKYDPNAMVLSTVLDGQPSGRVVLLKGFDERGFVFYTNFGSDKGRALAQNPVAALTFHWAELFRQVRVEGRVERLPEEESVAYFRSRPRDSRLSAMVSPQSQKISGRQELLDRMEELKERFEGVEDLEKPADWGGFRVVPARIEFWQGRTNRMHDRIVFERGDEGDEGFVGDAGDTKVQEGYAEHFDARADAQAKREVKEKARKDRAQNSENAWIRYRLAP